jgi:hypothetical protein
MDCEQSALAAVRVRLSTFQLHGNGLAGQEPADAPLSDPQAVITSAQARSSRLCRLAGARSLCAGAGTGSRWPTSQAGSFLGAAELEQRAQDEQPAEHARRRLKRAHPRSVPDVDTTGGATATWLVLERARATDAGCVRMHWVLLQVLLGLGVATRCCEWPEL